MSKKSKKNAKRNKKFRVTRRLNSLVRKIFKLVRRYEAIVNKEPERLPAPYLPPEIISTILHFIHPKLKDWSKPAESHPEFAPLSMISHSWKLEGQKRLYEAVRVRNDVKLSKLAYHAGSGSGRFILSLNITSDNSARVYAVINSTRNLRQLELNMPSCSQLSIANALNLRFPYLLPNLVNLSLRSNNHEWNRKLFDRILFTSSSKLVELTIGSDVEYSGQEWTSSLPSSLKKLKIIGPGINILSGGVWSLSQFEGLEVLEAFSKDWNENIEEILPFFEIIGPSSSKLIAVPSKVPSEIFRYFAKLSRLTVKDLPGRHTGLFLSRLPPTITKLSIIALNSDSLPSLSLMNLNNLTTLHLGRFSKVYNLSRVQQVSVLVIEHYSTAALLESLKSLSPGAASFTKLRLGTFKRGKVQLLEEQEIKIRCKELGITLRRLYHDWSW